MTDDWKLGDVVRQDDQALTYHLTGDHQVKVAAALDPTRGTAVVLVRFGQVLCVLEPDAAAVVAQALVTAAQAAVRANQGGAKS